MSPWPMWGKAPGWVGMGQGGRKDTRATEEKGRRRHTLENKLHENGVALQLGPCGLIG